MSAVDDLGFVKMDFLSLETLDLIKRTIDLVKIRRGKEIDIRNINIQDAMAFKFLNDKDAFEGLFQISNPAFAQMLKSMNPDMIDDVMAALALYRPGPLRSGATEEFCKKKANRESYEHPIKEIQDVLAATHGEIVYQEQIMFVCGILCNWTMGKCDNVRRIIGKKKLDKIADLKIEFMKDAKANLPHIEDKELEKVFLSIESAGKYSFNKSLDKDTLVCYNDCSDLIELELSNKKTIVVPLSTKMETTVGIYDIAYIIEHNLEILDGEIEKQETKRGDL